MDMRQDISKGGPHNTSDEIRYLLSFLAILVDRAGGELTINRLSDYANLNFRLEMKMDKEKDNVILSVSRRAPGGNGRERR